jgi:hypothetical protein
MKRSDFRTDISEVVTALLLTTDQFKLVSLHSYEQILVSILEKFTYLGKLGLDHSWLWESFNEPRISFFPESTIPLLPEIFESLVDPDERLWFVAEDWHRTKRNGNFWLYEGKKNSIISVLEEMYPFEYYIVSKKLDWLLCENHHGVLIGAGEPIIERLETVRAKCQG